MLCRLLYTVMVAMCPFPAASVKAQSGWTSRRGMYPIVCGMFSSVVHYLQMAVLLAATQPVLR